MDIRTADRARPVASGAPGTTGAAAPPLAAPVVDIVLPVYNEEVELRRNVLRLLARLERDFPLTWRVTIADNASTDATWRIACDLAERGPHVAALHLDQKGRGRALKAAWSASDARVLVYMDIDLATDLDALLPLVAPLVSGHSDLAIGTRLARASTVERGARREFISRGYNLLTKLALRTRFSDAQCGFKAIRADRARALLPWIEDEGWFFDTELLVVAERAGLRIHEVPVDWTDDPDSRVDIVPTAVADLKGIARVGRELALRELPLAELGRGRDRRGAARPRLLGQLVSFCLIGAASTLAYAALYLLLRQGMPAQAANFLSLPLTAVANTAANRRFTFGVRGTGGRLRTQGQGLIVFALGLAVTSGSLALLHAVGPAASHTLELAVLIAASVVATLLRFALFKAWIFPARGRRGLPRTAGGLR
ncbi:MAG TPA: bifunctional glycosyltransferase family 2/GtrA family protein [Thermoleophilia bacterium]|nr:bifunctional glycosyltransferase family 2/GtrA family protein [Thermoleophilia bacterium]